METLFDHDNQEKVVIDDTIWFLSQAMRDGAHVALLGVEYSKNTYQVDNKSYTDWQDDHLLQWEFAQGEFSQGGTEATKTITL